jgi:hypothetical protein
VESSGTDDTLPSAQTGIDEYEDILDAAPLCQGDIFEWVDPHGQRPWRNLGVIVTADCDIVRNKMDNVISFVPLLCFEDYLWHVWREKRFSQQWNLALCELTRFINKQLVKQGRSEIGQDAVRDWVARDNAETIAAALTLSDINLKGKLLAHFDRFSDFDRLLAPGPPDRTLLERACGHLKKANQTTNQFQAQDFQSTLSKLPGDVFYLSQVREERGGFFAMLRHIRQCDIEEIAIDADQIRFGSAKARRFARLRAPFKYALTQQLARVFSDIGLTAAYDERLKTGSAKFFGDTQ